MNIPLEPPSDQSDPLHEPGGRAKEMGSPEGPRQLEMLANR